MNERRTDLPRPADGDADEGRAQRVEPDEKPPGIADSPPDPDRPADEVERGSILVEPSPGD